MTISGHQKRIARTAFAMALSAMLFASLSARSASPPAYPNKPVRLILGGGVGGPTDGVARILATSLSALWGQSVVVDNRPGAGNTLATTKVAQAAPDGYTLLLCPLSDAVSPSLYPSLPYDFLRDIVPIGQIATTANVFVVNPTLPAHNVKEFIAYAKARPGEVIFGSPGPGQAGHLSMALLRLQAGIDVRYVSYKVGGLVITDLLAGRIQAQITNLPAHRENIRLGKVRALGVTTPKRSRHLPNVPAIAETLPGYEVTTWYGVCGPRRLSRSIVAQIGADLVRSVETPGTRDRLDHHGVEVKTSTPEQFAAFVTSEVAKWSKVVKVFGLSHE